MKRRGFLGLVALGFPLAASALVAARVPSTTGVVVALEPTPDLRIYGAGGYAFKSITVTSHRDGRQWTQQLDPLVVVRAGDVIHARLDPDGVRFVLNGREV